MISDRPILQVISTSPLDSRIIQAAGANRIELVSGLQIGGITPSSTIVRKSLQCVDIPTMIMVRHHNLGFQLEDEEKRLLIDQAISLCDLGSKGLVVGVLNSQNKVDEQFLKLFKDEISNKIDITFHKASDSTNIVQTYKSMKKYDIKRVLTQGGQQKIQENGEVIKNILKFQGVSTLLGGGINISNIKHLIKQYHPQQIHIGTCVRKNKYGPVQKSLVQEFICNMAYQS